MEVLDFITICLGQDTAVIELCCGDLTEMNASEEADILVISAAPNSYTPTANTVIGALHRKGISVRDLATRKSVDLRSYCCCWMSADLLSPTPGLHFRRILCFEPWVRGEAPEMVEDLFRCLTAFLNDSQPSYSIAMPLLATGDQAVPIVAMLGALLRSAVRWIKFGLPIRRLRIVEKSPLKAAWMKDEFALVKKTLRTEPVQESKRTRLPVSHVLSCALKTVCSAMNWCKVCKSCGGRGPSRSGTKD